MFISGWNVYDVSAPVPFSELTPLKPLDEYGASKLRIERFFNNELKDVQVLNLRSSSIYGPGQTSPGLITNLVKSALGSNKIILNAVSTKRDYLYIDDLAKSIIQLVALDAKSLPQTLNLGSGKSISVLEVAHSIQRICKKIRDLNISIEYAQELHESLLPDNCLAIYEAKKRGLLTKMISFEDGLSNYIEWRMNENIL
jgi:nucleoside-diphosphate-sugar epimerase